MSFCCIHDGGNPALATHLPFLVSYLYNALIWPFQRTILPILVSKSAGMMHHPRRMERGALIGGKSWKQVQLPRRSQLPQMD